jgi:DUF438 domain-containing protein
MSEHFAVDNGKQEKLKAIILKLHRGAPVVEVKKDFASLIQGVSAAEVAEMEQALIENGMPVEEIQRLCEVHVEVFKASLQKEKISSKVPGHPVQTMLEENRIARTKISALKKAVLSWRFGVGSQENVLAALEDLSKILVHYTRKENQLFPYLEKKAFTGPSRVMWGKHDEIRTLFREAQEKVGRNDKSAVAGLHPLVAKISRMIFMEEHILIPEAIRRLGDEEWAQIRIGEEAIGFSWTKPGAVYDPELVLAGAVKAKPPAASAAPIQGNASVPAGESSSNGHPAADLVGLATGLVPRALLSTALATMPVDISIVDAQDKVLYYSDSPHRIFPRSPGVIGRTVQNCHPQKSVATVNRILDAFRKKEKTSARFWLEMGGKFILIEYHALYDEKGAYAGTLEFSQDLTELRALQGQRRLLDWD